MTPSRIDCALVQCYSGDVMNVKIGDLNINYIDEGNGTLLVMLHGWAPT